MNEYFFEKIYNNAPIEIKVKDKFVGECVEKK